ncbi:MAG: ATPase [Roseibium sp.]|nr:ATPase [Roseibium sp.]
MKLTWRRTWPHKLTDGTGTHPAHPTLCARVYLEPDGRRWFWVVNETRLIAQGLANTKEDAKASAETAASQWAEMKQQ